MAGQFISNLKLVYSLSEKKFKVKKGAKAEHLLLLLFFFFKVVKYDQRQKRTRQRYNSRKEL